MIIISIIIGFSLNLYATKVGSDSLKVADVSMKHIDIDSIGNNEKDLILIQDTASLIQKEKIENQFNINNENWDLKIIQIRLLLNKENGDEDTLDVELNQVKELETKFNYLVDEIQTISLTVDTNDELKKYEQLVNDQLKLIFDLDVIYNQLLASDDVPLFQSQNNDSITTAPQINIENRVNETLITYTNDSAKQNKNQQSLEAFYVKDTIQFRDLISRFDKSSLSKSWGEYLKLKYGLPIEQMQSNQAVVSSETKEPTVGVVSQIVEPKSMVDFITKKNIEEKINKSNDDGIVFVVQILASRIQLSSSYLNQVYKGSLPIKERKEDQFYKYQIGNFPTFFEAKELLAQTNIKDAFIVPYLDGHRLVLFDVLTQLQTQSLEPKENVKSVFMDDGLVFVVQIAALKTELEGIYLLSKYKGVLPIRKIKEEGLYKYQIITGSSIIKAIRVLKSCEPSDYFVVAYLNNEKIPMYEALRIATK